MTRFASIDPATGEPVWEGAEATGAEIGAAVERARAAFDGWADRPRQDRIDAVKRYQAAVRARAPEIAEAISRETGKALWETTAELGAMQGKVDISIRAYDERTGERETATGFGRSTRNSTTATQPNAFCPINVSQPTGVAEVVSDDPDCGFKLTGAATFFVAASACRGRSTRETADA